MVVSPEHMTGTPADRKYRSSPTLAFRENQARKLISDGNGHTDHPGGIQVLCRGDECGPGLHADQGDLWQGHYPIFQLKRNELDTTPARIRCKEW